MLFADDSVGRRNREEVNQRLNVWKLALEEKGLRINRRQYIEYEFYEREQVYEMRSVITVSGDKGRLKI